MKFLGTHVLSLLLCWLFYSSVLTAQVSVFAPTINADPSTTIQADLTVSDFEDIGGISFSLGWDPTVLEIQSIDAFALPDIAQGQNYNVIPEEGKLGFLWFDLTLAGETLDDDAVFFSLVFDVIGEIGDSTGLVFTNDPTQKEVLDTSPATLDANFENGWVKINGPDQVYYNDAPELIQVKSAFPNPFHDFTKIELELKESLTASLEIIDIQGKLISQDEYQLFQGKNELILSKEKFPLPGTYFVQLKSSKFTIRQKLIVN